MRHLLAAVVVTLVIAAVAGCSGDEVGAGEAAVEITEGSRVLVAERGDDLTLAEGRRTLHLGADVKVLAGSATISLADGTRLEVRDGSEVGIGTPIELVAADLLVTSGRGPVEVEAAGSSFAVDGVAQISRDLAVSASSYQGSVTVRSAARGLRIPALRQASVASLGVVPASPAPLDYDETDPWDRRFLAEAIELGDQLEAKSRGFTESIGPGEGRTAGFYRVLIPDLEDEPQFDESLLTPDLAPGHALVGATIALRGQVAASFADRWAAVFSFRNQGAQWGLVALDQQVTDTSGLVESVNAAIGRQTFAFAPTPAPTSPPPPPAPAPPQPTVPAGPPPPAERTRSPETTPTTRPPATKPDEPLLTVPTVPPLLAPPDPDQPPPPGLLEPLVNTLTATLDGLLGGNGDG